MERSPNISWLFHFRIVCKYPLSMKPMRALACYQLVTYSHQSCYDSNLYIGSCLVVRQSVGPFGSILTGSGSLGSQIKMLLRTCYLSFFLEMMDIWRCEILKYANHMSACKEVYRLHQFDGECGVGT